MKDFAKLYDVIKNERNKCVNLIQTSTQKAAEMKEKIKILQNEIEILRTEVSKKDKSVFISINQYKSVQVKFWQLKYKKFKLKFQIFLRNPSQYK